MLGEESERPDTHAERPDTHMWVLCLCRQREDLQPVFSFKLRGAYNKIVSSTPEQLARGVVACSAGNHAQVCGFDSSVVSRAVMCLGAEPAVAACLCRVWRCRLRGTTSRP